MMNWETYSLDFSFYSSCGVVAGVPKGKFSSLRGIAKASKLAAQRQEMWVWRDLLYGWDVMALVLCP